MINGGHRILIRLDQRNNKWWLFDPNVGIFTFENHHPQSQTRLLDCLFDLLKVHYPTTWNVAAYQKTPLA
jgi:hypothetical protein